MSNEEASQLNTAEIQRWLATFEPMQQHDLVEKIVRNGVQLGLHNGDRLDLKITAAALEEMNAAFALFQPYRAVKKATIFGSARTQQDDPSWAVTEELARRLADAGWMIVTGAGPGIMEAAATGAGPDRSLGVSIRLPFEEHPNATVNRADRLVSMKYFFTRKLMLVRESSGFVCVPGGFGTLDETLELLTLQQTGKSEPAPIVLLDKPGGTYWHGFQDFVRQQLSRNGFIAEDDLDRVCITDSVERAATEILDFWKNYHSLRWCGEQLVFRVRTEVSENDLAVLNERFQSLCEHGGFEKTAALPCEVVENDEVQLPRIVWTPKHRSVGELYRVIRVLNTFEAEA